MHTINRILQNGTSQSGNGFAADLAALCSLCFAGYLGLLVF